MTGIARFVQNALSHSDSYETEPVPVEGLTDKPRPGYQRVPRLPALAESHAVSA